MNPSFRARVVQGLLTALTGLATHPGDAESPRRPSPPRAEASSGMRVTTVKEAGVRFQVVTMDLKQVSLRLVRMDESGRALRNFQELEASVRRRGGRLLAATNSGIFEPGETPTGLFVQDGRELVSLNLRDGAGNFYWKPNGVFLVGNQGAAVIESSRYPGVTAVKQATQSGPLLLREGQHHPGLTASRSAFTRSGVGVDARNPWRVHLVLSREPVSLETFARFFQARLGCTDALYLDGAISHLYVPALHEAAPDTGGPFSGFLVVTETP